MRLSVLQYARKTDIASVEIFSKDPISEMPSRLILLTMEASRVFPPPLRHGVAFLSIPSSS